MCEVVRVKVESEENVNRISRGNAEEIVLVSINYYLGGGDRTICNCCAMMRGVINPSTCHCY